MHFDNGNSVSEEHLSEDAQYQLAICLRLALIQDLQDDEIDLPMIIGESWVNPESQFGDATCMLLAEIANGGQQIICIASGVSIPFMEMELPVMTIELEESTSSSFEEDGLSTL